MTLDTTAATTPAAHACREPYGFWLDSALVDGRLGRASLWGQEPYLILRSKGNDVELWQRGGTSHLQASPFAVLRQLLRDERRSPEGGVAGYFAYDLKQHVERLPSRAQDDLALPDCYLCFYDRINRFDPRLAAPHPIEGDGGKAGRPEITSTFTPEAYRRAVERAKRYISDGDIYQVNLSQRFQAPLRQQPLDLYLRLRRLNPAPFAAYLNLPEAQVLSASPERFLLFDPESRRVQTRPIKGTRPRGATADDDRRLSQELLESEKDRAENVMIVDVERNDLGRVAEIGSVQAPHLTELERFATVFHLTSTVEAHLRPDRDLVDLLLATFPSGSITGAPKIRAMEIIDELEPTARSVYTGAIGYIGFDGRLELNIAIRTILVKGETAYFQAGGGVVADSDPAAEYQETLDKAGALAQAVLGER